mgnify:CR=1 FL=1
MADTHRLIVAIGDLFLDLLGHVPGLPRRGTAVWGAAPIRCPGGTTGNVAAGLARLGEQVLFVGAVGDDDVGKFLVEDLAASGVDVSGVAWKPGISQGLSIALIEPDGERTFLGLALKAAPSHLAPADLTLIDRLSPPPSMIFLTGPQMREEPARSTQVGFVRRWQGRAPLYFDTNLQQCGASPERVVVEALREVAARSDVVMTSEDDMQALGLKPGPGQLYAVKRGAQGARLVTVDGIVAEVAGHQVAVLDALGAGDVFDAGFMAARARRLADADALCLANAAAALSVEKPGGRSAPEWAEAAALAGLTT